MDALGYQHNERTKQIVNKHNITLYKVPSNSTAWIQPCHVLLLGPAKHKVCKQHKRDRQSDIRPALQRICEQFNQAIHSVSNSAVKRTWDGIDSEPIHLSN